MPNLKVGLFSALLCIWGSAIISTNVNAAVPNYDSLKSELKAETRQFNKDIKASIKESDAAMDEIVDAANRDKFESDMNDYIVAQTTGEIGNITFNQYNRQKEAKQEQKMQARGNTLDAQVMADIEAGIQEDIANIDKDFNKTIESEIRQFNTGMQQGTDIQSVSVKNDMSEQGGKVMGQKSLDEVELLYSQMTTTERAQYEEAITELGRACDELHALGGVHSACGD